MRHGVCLCPKHRPRTLADVAPRLAAARMRILDTLQRDRRRRIWLGEQLLDAERVLAHRELQLVRARRAGYMMRRRRLLEEARQRVETYMRLLTEAERQGNDYIAIYTERRAA